MIYRCFGYFIGKRTEICSANKYMNKVSNRNMFKVDNKGSGATSLTLFRCLHCSLWICFTSFLVFFCLLWTGKCLLDLAFNFIFSWNDGQSLRYPTSVQTVVVAATAWSWHVVLMPSHWREWSITYNTHQFLAILQLIYQTSCNAKNIFFLTFEKNIAGCFQGKNIFLSWHLLCTKICISQNI